MYCAGDIITHAIIIDATASSSSSSAAAAAIIRREKRPIIRQSAAARPAAVFVATLGRFRPAGLAAVERNSNDVWL